MKTSPEIGELAKALAAARAEFPPITRNRTVHVAMKSGGTYDFDYATLDHILDLVVPHLSKQGLSLSGGPDGGVYEGRLMHASGQWLSASMAIPDNLEPQDIGKALTYFGRYIVGTLLAIAGEQDDDGNAISGNQAVSKPRTAAARPKAPAPPPADPLAARDQPEAKPSRSPEQVWQGFMNYIGASSTAQQVDAGLLGIENFNTTNDGCLVKSGILEKARELAAGRKRVIAAREVSQ